MQPSSQDWVGKPANVKLHPSLSSGVVALVLGVPRLVKVAVERDADCALLSVPKVLATIQGSVVLSPSVHCSFVLLRPGALPPVE